MDNHYISRTMIIIMSLYFIMEVNSCTVQNYFYGTTNVENARTEPPKSRTLFAIDSEEERRKTEECLLPFNLVEVELEKRSVRET